MDDPELDIYLCDNYFGLDCHFGRVEWSGLKRKEWLEPDDITAGTIICLEFNADGCDSYIKFSKPDTKQEVMIDSSEIKIIKYRLAISLAEQDDSFTILDFKCN